MIGYKFNAEGINDDDGFYEQPFDALKHVVGNTLYMAKKDLETEHKWQTVNSFDATGLIKGYARWKAHECIHLWSAPDLVIYFLNTGNENFRAISSALSQKSAVVAQQLICAMLIGKDVPLKQCVNLAKEASSAWASAMASMATGQPCLKNCATGSERNMLLAMHNDKRVAKANKEDFNFLVDLEFEKMRIKEQQNE